MKTKTASRFELDKNDLYEGDIKAFIKRKKEEGHKPNRLIDEKSPYLLQHAFNPVNWYPWGDEAFDKAKEEDKFIFLSIGYSTCYWCHVMEREIFEVPEIAEIMNKLFISVKVDREERPDVDRIYMQALQMMTGSGGWPMSIFMTNDLKPFWGGTYIPPETKYGRPGFVDLIKQLDELWRTKRNEIYKNAENLYSVLSEHQASAVPSTMPDAEDLDSGYKIFERMYDDEYGGFGEAPKFPRVSVFNFLFRYAVRTGNEKAKEMVLRTLRKMAAGGIFDQIGGGFHRYSTDARWHVPHFEKMLYDQGQLVSTYLDAYQLTGDEYFSNNVRDVLNYVSNNLTDENGGFYSAEDAESATSADNLDIKAEGAFYIWSKSELMELLGEEAGNIFVYYYGVESSGNVLEDPHNYFPGNNVLYLAHTLKETATKFDIPVNEVKKMLRDARTAVYDQREKRINPHLDDKILVSWNGYMISAYSRAYQILHDDSYLLAAERAAIFIKTNLYNAKERTLLRRFRDGEAGIEANLSDYALLAGSMIDLYEASFNADWIEWADELTDLMIEKFYDEKSGAFYDTPEGSVNLIVRMRDDYDGAEPTGNSIAVMNLLRLSQILDKEKYREIADKTVSYYSDILKKSPHALPQMLAAVDFSLVKPKQIIIAGKANSEDIKMMLNSLHEFYIPNKVIIHSDSEDDSNYVSKNLEIVKYMKMIDGKATAYVCENYACKLPTNDLEVFISLLDETSNL
ncbi:MAG: thioredoxin domain-containing protein [Candidatus Marinimicrobia bacterium]|nr:thioredoxin domain-containing protein [Candidatus Neomarinimicrobiota bacterium]